MQSVASATARTDGCNLAINWPGFNLAGKKGVSPLFELSQLYTKRGTTCTRLRLVSTVAITIAIAILILLLILVLVYLILIGAAGACYENLYYVLPMPIMSLRAPEATY